MKKFILIFCTTLFTSLNLFAQLPAAAQILYDSAYAQDPMIVNLALSNGAQILATPDGESFYVQWFPLNAIPNATPLIVSLHGSHCNAFMEFASWFQRAQLHGCGIIAIQWNRYNPNPPLDYFPDDTLYNYIDSSLSRINYPSNKALLHGFSRGSARSYSMIFNDIQSGNNYFCTTIANSGDADLGYPLYAAIDSGTYGPNVFAGKHWNLFCGGLDTIVGCAKMNATQTWLQGQGATVDIFIQDPNLNHDGFQLPTSFAYKDSILNKYLQCYNSTASIADNSARKEIKLSPNPFSTQTILHSETSLTNASLAVYNLYGEKVLQMENISGKSIILNRNNLSSGIYFFRLTQKDKLITTDKLIITD